MNSPTSINEMGLAVKISSQKRKLQDQMYFLEDFSKCLSNKQYLFYTKFPNNSRGKYISMSLYEEGMSLMPKTIQTNKQKPESRDITKKVNYRPELHIKPDTKILHKILGSHSIYKKMIHHSQVRFILGMKVDFYTKIIKQNSP